jgi:hypothetical protein
VNSRTLLPPRRASRPASGQVHVAAADGVDVRAPAVLQHAGLGPAAVQLDPVWVPHALPSDGELVMVSCTVPAIQPGCCSLLPTPCIQIPGALFSCLLVSPIDALGASFAGGAQAGGSFILRVQ